MRMVVLRMVAKPGCGAQLITALEENRAGTRMEPGNIAFDIYKSEDTDDEVILVEAFTDAQAIEAHRQSNHFLAFKAKAPEFLQHMYKYAETQTSAA